MRLFAISLRKKWSKFRKILAFGNRPSFYSERFLSEIFNSAEIEKKRLVCLVFERQWDVPGNSSSNRIDASATVLIYFTIFFSILNHVQTHVQHYELPTNTSTVVHSDLFWLPYAHNIIKLWHISKSEDKHNCITLCGISNSINLGTVITCTKGFRLFTTETTRVRCWQNFFYFTRIFGQFYCVAESVFPNL